MNIMREKIIGFSEDITRREIEDHFKKRWDAKLDYLFKFERGQYYYRLGAVAIFPDEDYMQGTLPSYKYSAGSARYISKRFSDKIGESLEKKNAFYKRYKEIRSSLDSSATVGKYFALIKTPDDNAQAFFKDFLNIESYPTLLSRFTEKTAPDFEWPDLDPLTFFKSDKLMYKPDEDCATLAVAIPGQSNIIGEIIIAKEDVEWHRVQIRLNEAGMATCKTPELPKGQYEAVFKFVTGYAEIDSPEKLASRAPWWVDGMRGEYEEKVRKGEILEKLRCGGTEYTISCRFEAGTYKLPEFEASLLSVTRSGRIIEFGMVVKCLGRAYSGDVTLELIDEARTIQSSQAVCGENGVLEGQFRLSGNGPFSIRVLSQKGSASLFLLGSSASSRRVIRTDDGCDISAFPDKDTETARGLYLKEGIDPRTKFRIKNHITPECILKITAECRIFAAVAVDQEGSTIDTYYEESVEVGTEWRFRVPANYAFIFWAVSDGEVFEEGWTVVIKPAELKLSLQVQPRAHPKKNVKINIATNQAKKTVPVLVSVRDKRLNIGSSPLEHLARQLKEEYLDAQVKCFSAIPPVSDVGSLLIWDRILYEHNDRYEMKCRNHESKDCRRRWIDLDEYYKHQGFCPKCKARGESTKDTPRSGMMMRLKSSLETGIGDAYTGSKQPSEPAIEGSDLPPAINSQDPTSKSLKSFDDNIRRIFQDSLYFEIVSVKGRREIEVPVRDTIGNYTVEAFALFPRELDWHLVKAEFEVTRDVYGILQVPGLLFPGDGAEGHLYARTRSAQRQIEVTCNSQDVDLQPVRDTDDEFVYEVKPGLYRSLVKDLKENRSDCMELRVQEVGKFIHKVPTLSVLKPGEEISVNDEVHAITILVGIETIMVQLGKATSHYENLCCEQTAAKLLAGMLLWELTKEETKRVEIEDNLLSGVKRLKSMMLPSFGFAMYPGRGQDNYYGKKTANYLLYFSEFSFNFGNEELNSLMMELLEFAPESAKQYGILPVKTPFDNCHAAYLGSLSKDEGIKQAAIEFASRNILRIFSADNNTDIVDKRAETAYAAAILAQHDQASDKVFEVLIHLGKAFNEHGRLYSTIDSIALLIFLKTLDRVGFLMGNDFASASDKVFFNGTAVNISKALTLQKKKVLTHLKSGEQPVLVRTIENKYEEWGSGNLKEIPQITLVPDKNTYHVGDTIRISIDLPKYRPGLIAEFYLPPVLARLQGGTWNQSFNLDFKGNTRLETEIKVVSGYHSPQHAVIAIRNMFKEEEFWCSDKIQITVDTP